MKIPFLTCLTCSQNNGNTQIKVRSSCFEKPIIINVDNEDSLVAIQEILTKILGVKEPAPTDTVVETTVI